MTAKDLDEGGGEASETNRRSKLNAFRAACVGNYRDDVIRAYAIRLGERFRVRISYAYAIRKLTRQKKMTNVDRSRHRSTHSLLVVRSIMATLKSQIE